MVLEFEQREAAHKAVANAVYTASSSSADPHAGKLADTKKELAKLKAEVKAAAKAAAKANANQTLAAATKGKGKGGDAEKKICSRGVKTSPAPGKTEARLSSLDGPTSREPGGEDREFLRFDGEESLEFSSPSGGTRKRPPTAPCPKLSSLYSALWRRFRGCGRQGPRKDSFSSLQRKKTRVSAHETWSPRSVETAACECGAVETVFRTEPQADSCEHEESCFACGSSERLAARSFQGCSSCSRSFGWARRERRSGLSPSLPQLPSSRAVSEGAPCRELRSRPSNFTARDQWWDAPGGQASVWTRRPKAEELGSLGPKVPFETCLLQKPGEPLKNLGHPRSAFAPERAPGGRASCNGAPRGLQDKTRAEVGRLATAKSILFGFSFGINKAEVCVAEGSFWGTRLSTSRLSRRSCTSNSSWRARIGSGGICPRSMGTQPKSLASGRSQGPCSQMAGWVRPPPRDARLSAPSRR